MTKTLSSFFDFLSKRMVFADPPLHTHLRGLLNKAFYSACGDGHADSYRAISQRVSRCRDGSGKMDFIRDFAFPLPATVITEMLGVNSSDPIN